MDDSFRMEGTGGAIVGGLCLVSGHLLNYIGNQPTGTTLVFLGHVVLVFAFIGAYAHRRRRRPATVGYVGMLLSTIGTILVSAIVFVELAGTTGVDTTPVFAAAGISLLYSVGPLVFVLGMILVGGSIIRQTDLPRTAGGILVAGTLVFGGANALVDLAAPLTALGAALTAGGSSGAALYSSAGSHTNVGGFSSDG